ncbi:MAG: hypothetical protein EZS26_001007 [Candidatus Ordinivivax streblomastigis]|uniref:Uncharacterized protein n=1 Tax=Candidatus Ordinivivax streblomastigis TaxID=2540710 RepID=A0A5M8P2X9_9BACT|nr:MAG: hypothetical protein EZS26_001007 [Candidatus Ordinivivax streblomastigis]
MAQENRRYILDPENYKGSIFTSMSDGVHDNYGGRTLEELRIREKNPNLQALTWEEYKPIHEQYENSLCKSFAEITEEEYWEYLEVLPPKRYNGNSFFMGECFSGSLYQFCFKLKGKYYSALRSIFLTNEELMAQIKEFEKSNKRKKYE